MQTISTVPGFRFLHSSQDGPVPFAGNELNDPIPQSRPMSDAGSPPEITYKTYLGGVQDFILKNWEQFSQILRDRYVKQTVGISSVTIVAEKHGSDYHPARVIAETGDARESFVVNAAVSERGKSRLMQDYRLLGELGAQHPRMFVPEVYFADTVSVCEEGCPTREIYMFLGEWLEGFYEFHLSRDEATKSLITVLWDTDRGYGFLTAEEAASIYKQASCILTYYYDMDAFREVFPWHHAAGDFIASRPNGPTQVRLITVRQYAPRTEFEEQSPENRLHALVLFLANLTVRMRLDRLDGVGEVAWAPEQCVEATVQGFVDALHMKVGDGTADPRMMKAFLALAKDLSLEDLAGIFARVIESYDEAAPDAPLVREQIVDHILKVYLVLQSLSK